MDLSGRKTIYDTRTICENNREGVAPDQQEDRPQNSSRSGIRERGTRSQASFEENQTKHTTRSFW